MCSNPEYDKEGANSKGNLIISLRQSFGANSRFPEVILSKQLEKNNKIKKKGTVFVKFIIEILF
ncbi:hypothetical protein GCM10022258_09670 [Aquimarina gracilis]